MLREHLTSRVPILVGGGSRPVLRIAAQQADVVGLTGFSATASGPVLTHLSADGLEARLAFVRTEAGARAGELTFQALVQHLEVTDDREAAAARLVDEWVADGETSLDVEAALASPFLLFGTAAEIAAQLVARSTRFGIATWTTFLGRPTDPSTEALRAVAAALAD